MPAYLIARMEVLDVAAFKPYTLKTPRIVAKHGGKYLVNAGRCEYLEGKGPERHVLIEFPDMKIARRFYRSEEFKQVLPLAKQFTKRDLILIEGSP